MYQSLIKRNISKKIIFGQLPGLKLKEYINTEKTSKLSMFLDISMNILKNTGPNDTSISINNTCKVGMHKKAYWVKNGQK